MKKLSLIMLLCLLPLQAFAISNFKINGASTYTVTSVPANVVLTGDLASNGNHIELEMYMDTNNNNVVDAGDLLIDYLILTDGIGWIRDLESPDDDIPGDETGVDGKIKTSFEYTKEDGFLTGTFIFKATEQNGSTASTILIFNVEPVPPFITGKITDKLSGVVLPAIVVMIDKKGEDGYGTTALTDENGDYIASVEAGDYSISTSTLGSPDYMPSDTLNVTVGANETKIVNIQLEKFSCFVEGYVKRENNTPVEGVMISVSALDYENWFWNMVTTNSEGYYRLGVEPDSMVVSAYTVLSAGLTENEYVEPTADTLFFTPGQSQQRNFTVKQYTTTIEGVCTVNNQPLAGVEITGMALDFELGFMNIFTTESKQDGTYKLGVKPGNIAILQASLDGYSVVTPDFAYTDINITQNQHLTGYDFTFQAEAGGKEISGQITYENGSAAANVYVVAINDDEDSKNGFLITYTDGAGNYKFENVLDGSWQIGVYKSGYHTDPYMIYDYVMTGYSITDANFVLVPGETGIEDGDPAVAPLTFALAQNYPNPFNLRNGINQTHIRFTLDQRKDIEISIFNIQGQLVKQVFYGNMDQGWHEVQWDGRDFSGNLVPSGAYFYRLEADNKSFTKQMIIIR